MRLATNARALGDDAVTLNQAWILYDTFLSDPRIAFVAEPANVETLWRRHTQRRSFSSKLWNDAYLAAFAQAGGYEVVTFDKGFAQDTELRYTILGSA